MLKIGLLFRTVLAEVLELQNHLLKLLSYFRHSSGNSETRLQATPTGKIPKHPCRACRRPFNHHPSEIKCAK